MATRPNNALDPLAEKLRQVHTIPALVQYLHDELDWPVNVEDWEDNLFDWEPGELNLKDEHEVKIKSIKQLRPLVSGQPWGIFFVEFNKGRLPITALRRVLNGLVPKGRATGGGHQTWAAHDLLFVSSFGESNTREIALAHFTDESAQGDLPTLRVLGWDDDDTHMQLGYVAQTLRDKLRWPANTHTADDLAKWRAQWSSAFSLGYGQVINDTKTLALAMAELAKRIRRRVNTVLMLESDSGHLRQMHKAFKDNLIADLSDDAFADMFAQTITYGLFTARASRSSGALVADNLADMVPSTNPFLKELLGSFLSAAGRARSRQKRVDFDELGINEVVTTLREVPMDAVLRSFNATKLGDDPVIHFYEDFLKAYDKAMRAKRGVFYTPSPVVQFIVRSVDEILKTEFGIEDGLASTITWGEMMARKPELTLPKFCTAATPFVQVLDPATGTGTFIVEVITQIHAHMLGKWAKQGKVTKVQWQPLWADYVKHHLLPRLYAFELMMAPYAIAHMKIGLKLAETGYTFPEDGPRVNVFLTNALEPAHEVNPELAFEAPMLAHEASAANRVKEYLCATVIVGNPPYSKASQNLGEQYQHLIERFRMFSGERIREPGAILFERDINNDYAKFLGLSRNSIERSATGILGLITSSSYLDGKNFRGVRDALTTTFNSLKVINLHGNSRSGSLARQGIADENVFEIETGVNILLATKKEVRADCSTLTYGDAIGSYDHKVHLLLTNDASLAGYSSAIDPRRYKSLVPTESLVLDEYSKFHRIDSLYGLAVDGIKTSRDGLVIATTAAECALKIRAFMNFKGSPESLEQEFGISVANWDFASAQRYLQQNFSTKRIFRLAYRPLDFRYIYYDSNLVFSHREGKMSHLIKGDNLALVCASRLSANGFNHVLPADCLVEMKYASHDTNSRVFPVFLYGASNSNSTAQPNMGVAASEIFGSLKTPSVWTELNEAALALLNSPNYRTRYFEEIKNDFPRIPLLLNNDLRMALSGLGRRLIRAQLLRSEVPDSSFVFGGKLGENICTPVLVDGRLHLSNCAYFAGVSLEIFEFQLAGYQVCKNWVSAGNKSRIQRKGTVLTQKDVQLYRQVLFAIQETIEIRSLIDSTIESHGSWQNVCIESYPLPDATNLLLAQVTFEDQLKAQKKSATATKKRAASVSPTGASSLFDDLEDMAGAAGGPDRPKSRATPAKAAGGSNNNAEWAVLCAIRVVLTQAGAGGILRKDLIRQTARALGHARTSPRIAETLDGAVRLAVRRGIAINDSGNLRLLARRISDYDHEFLKQHLFSCLTKVWCCKTDVPLRFARSLGFARTGAKLEELVWTLMASLRRAGSVQMQGRGINAQYRKAQSLKGSGS